MKKIKLFPRINTANNQINLSLPKRKVPKQFQKKLNKLKWIEVDPNDFDWEEE